MERSKGSFNWDDPDRPRWTVDTVHEEDFSYTDADGHEVYQVQRGRNLVAGKREKVFRQRRRNPDWEYDRFGSEHDEWIYNVEGVQLFPFHLTRLVQAPLDETIFVVEGERKVLALEGMNKTATSCAGGAGKWRDEFSIYFRGRSVIVIPDNDEKGRDHAADVVRSLSNVAKSVRVLELPNLPEHGDVVDWVEAGGSSLRLDALVAQLPTRLHTLSAATFADQPTPARTWLFPELMPARNVTSVYGDGGLGKTLLALQCAVSVVTGTHWIGVSPQRTGPVVYFGCEDELDEMHRRLKDICTAEGLDVANLKDLHLVDMAGKDALLAIENSRKAVLEKTPLLAQLRATLAEVRPALLVLDNLADIFGGNEIVKSLARQFIGLLRGLAIEFDCVVLLLAHPSQAGRSSGDGTSGNSAWNNSVRQRLYLKPQADSPDDITDERLRRLEVMKSNYGPAGLQFELRWDRGRFALAGPVPVAGTAAGRAAKEQKSDTTFMALLADFIERGAKVSPNPSPSFAPTIFAKQPEAKGIGKEQLEKAMYRLMKAGRIQIVDVGKGSKASKGFRIVPPDEVPM